MAYGDLFRHFTIRFSMKKQQHVRLLEKFEDDNLNDGKVKNQIVMDALEMYYDALEAGRKQEVQEDMTSAYLEKRLSEMKGEIKTELLQEVVRIVLGNAVAGQRGVAAGIPEREQTGERDVADISGMSDIMDKVMGWSEN